MDQDTLHRAAATVTLALQQELDVGDTMDASRISAGGRIFEHLVESLPSGVDVVYAAAGRIGIDADTPVWQAASEFFRDGVRASVGDREKVGTEGVSLALLHLTENLRSGPDAIAELARIDPADLPKHLQPIPRSLVQKLNVQRGRGPVSI